MRVRPVRSRHGNTRSGPPSFSRRRTSVRINSGEKITEGVPLVKLVKRSLVKSPELVLADGGNPLARERFRRLKTLLTHDAKERNQVVVVTGAAPLDGTSLVAMNLALAFAADDSGEILLVDANLRRPTVGDRLRPEPYLGLRDILEGQTELEHTVVEIENSKLSILPAGLPPQDPIRLLSSQRLVSLFSTLRKRYRRVIVDTPSILPFTDADVVGGLSDGVLIVARCAATPQATYAQALESITSARVIGAVLNDAASFLAEWSPPPAEPRSRRSPTRPSPDTVGPQTMREKPGSRSGDLFVGYVIAPPSEAREDIDDE